MNLLVAASHGGHWVEIRRLSPAFYHDQFESTVEYVCTQPVTVTDMDRPRPVHVVQDCNLRTPFRFIRCLAQTRRVVKSVRPDVVVAVVQRQDF